MHLVTYIELWVRRIKVDNPNKTVSFVSKKVDGYASFLVIYCIKQIYKYIHMSSLTD